MIRLKNLEQKSRFFCMVCNFFVGLKKMVGKVFPELQNDLKFEILP